MAVATALQKKNWASPDDSLTAPRARVDTISIGGQTITRVNFEPGWRWSEHTRPSAGTELCERPHLGCCLSGRLAIRMADGSETEIAPGDVVNIPPGHDAWVVGDESFVALDFAGGDDLDR